MITSISSQATIFLCTVIGGAAIALVYDLFRILRKAVRTGSLFIYVEDLLYWLIVSIIMLLTIYYSNDGELRAFMFIGACIGVTLYALLLSRIVMASSLFIIRIVSYPFILIIKVLKAPICKIVQLIADCIRMTSVSVKKAASEARASAKAKAKAKAEAKAEAKASAKTKAKAKAKAKNKVKTKSRQRRSQQCSRSKGQ